MNLVRYAEAEITKADMQMVQPFVSAVRRTFGPMTKARYQYYRIESWTDKGELPYFYRARYTDYLNETSLKTLVDSGITKLQVRDMESHAILLTITMLTNSS
jgi:hypothetical protein